MVRPFDLSQFTAPSREQSLTSAEVVLLGEEVILGVALLDAVLEPQLVDQARHLILLLQGVCPQLEQSRKWKQWCLVVVMITISGGDGGIGGNETTAKVIV